MAAVTCVHCGTRSTVTFFPRHGRWDDPLLSWVQQEGLRNYISNQHSSIVAIIDEIDNVLTLSRADGKKEKWRIGRCEGCKKPLLLIVSENEEDILQVFPAISLDPPQDLPPGVASDFVEGSLCLSVRAHKAAVSMFRRALQAAALDKGSKKEKLVDQLDELGTKGLLNATLLEVAHQVRHFGNFGTHPGKDGLGDVDEGEAEAIKQLTWQVLEDLYVNPRRRDAMKATLAAKKGPASP